MNRREALTAVGATAAGLTASVCAKADHDQGKSPLAVNSKHYAPFEKMHLYLCAYHIAKSDPNFVVEAHHYCSPVAEEVHQCVIYDKSSVNARILGVEYIISDRLYRQLPESEKKYYHPHTYEITGGLLIAPGMKEADETKLLEGLITSWGKTWHTWPDPQTDLPMGDPLLMWAATKDGQISSEELDRRDQRFGVSTARLRQIRSHIGPIPQIDPPKSIEEIGRQWTNEGPDTPPKRTR